MSDRGEDTPLLARYTKLFRLVGVRNGKPITAHSVFGLSINFANLCYLVYTAAFTDCNMNKIAHFMFLGYFYAGTLWTTISRSREMMWAAAECDKFVGLDGPVVESQMAAFADEIRRSGLKVFFNMTSPVAATIATYTCIEPVVKHVLFNTELQFPLTGTHENSTVFVTVYLLQCLLMFVTVCAMVVVIETLMELPFNLTAKYHLLNHQIASLNLSMIDNDDIRLTALYKTVLKCVETHQHILRIMEVYGDVCTYGFRFSYIGLLGATSLSRSLLSGDNPDLGVVPHIVAELWYIGSFCCFLDQLETENDKLRDAVFSSEWYRMPKEVTSSLRLLMERTFKRPHVYLYSGGGPANLECFFKLLNGTCCYIIFGIILDRAL